MATTKHELGGSSPCVCVLLYSSACLCVCLCEASPPPSHDVAVCPPDRHVRVRLFRGSQLSASRPVVTGQRCAPDVRSIAPPCGMRRAPPQLMLEGRARRAMTTLHMPHRSIASRSEGLASSWNSDCCPNRARPGRDRSKFAERGSNLAIRPIVVELGTNSPDSGQHRTTLGQVRVIVVQNRLALPETPQTHRNWTDFD